MGWTYAAVCVLSISLERNSQSDCVLWSEMYLTKAHVPRKDAVAVRRAERSVKTSGIARAKAQCPTLRERATANCVSRHQRNWGQCTLPMPSDRPLRQTLLKTYKVTESCRIEAAETCGQVTLESL